MDNIERYDSKEDRWERVEHAMRTARSVCVFESERERQNGVVGVCLC